LNCQTFGKAKGLKPLRESIVDVKDALNFATFSIQFTEVLLATLK